MTDFSQEPKWYVLQVRPRSEKKVEQQLKKLGVEACVPTQKQVRLWSDRKKVVDSVLFNNFVNLAPCKDIFDLISNVLKYVSPVKRIATLSD
jgi:transcription antitermination factor NusG